MPEFKEGVDYEHIPHPRDDKAWSIRVLEGVYSETVISFGTITIDGEDNEDSQMTFDFTLESSPIDDLDEGSLEFQDFAGNLLTSIIETAIIHKTGEMKEL
tara:strand:- start:606 stop:908 length:303 start_codon:yes stop_codon:yes gene_type:complete